MLVLSKIVGVLNQSVFFVLFFIRQLSHFPIHWRDFSCQVMVEAGKLARQLLIAML